MTTDPAAAAAQLAALREDRAALREDRAALADRAMQPWWYDALLGLTVIGLFGAMAVGNPFVTVAAVVLFVLSGGWFMRTYERLTGFWVSGLRTGRTRRAVTVWFVLYALIVVPALVFSLVFDQWWTLAAAGAVLGVSIALISQWWTRIYIAELREER